MPIYEYLCQQCGQLSEFIQKVSDDPQTQCPHCEQFALKKLLSSPAFHLKGEGWYVTDFRDKNKKKTPETATTTDTKETKDTEKKPAADSKEIKTTKDQ